MIRHIENLRSKPEHIRKGIAFFTSLGITLIIFVFWFTSHSLTSLDGTTPVQAKIDAPASSLTANVSGFYSYITGFFAGTKDVENSSDAIEVTGGGR